METFLKLFCVVFIMYNILVLVSFVHLSLSQFSNINCSMHLISTAIQPNYKDLYAFDTDNYLFIAISNLTSESVFNNSLLNFYANVSLFLSNQDL